MSLQRTEMFSSFEFLSLIQHEHCSIFTRDLYCTNVVTPIEHETSTELNHLIVKADSKTA